MILDENVINMYGANKGKGDEINKRINAVLDGNSIFDQFTRPADWTGKGGMGLNIIESICKTKFDIDDFTKLSPTTDLSRLPEEDDDIRKTPLYVQAIAELVRSEVNALKIAKPKPSQAKLV